MLIRPIREAGGPYFTHKGGGRTPILLLREARGASFIS